jgi:hypothetical protein
MTNAARQQAYRDEHRAGLLSAGMTETDLKAIANLGASAGGHRVPYPGLGIHELSRLLRDQVDAHVRALIESRHGKVGECYLAAWEHYGIACSHPDVDGDECLLCGARIERP